ncbi:MAG: Hpt domain-containing protein, partial [Ktedonobacteraceae bacterium]
MSNTFDKLSVLDSFIEEVNSYLPEIEANLERLAQSPDDMDALEETYRHAHTIGGSASMMDFPGLAHVAHGMEDILGDVMDGVSILDEPTLGLLRRSFGRMCRLLEGIRDGVDEDAVIAEDDADYVQYRTFLDPSAQPTSATHTSVNANSQTQGVSEPLFDEESSIDLPSSSSMPSLDEVLASFRTPSVTSGENISWPEESAQPVQSAPTSPSVFHASIEQEQDTQIETASVPASIPVSGSALDTLIASTRDSFPQEAPPATPSPSSTFPAEGHEQKSAISPVQTTYGNQAFQPVQPGVHSAASNEVSKQAFPEIYANMQEETEALHAQASSLKDMLDQLRMAMSVIEAQRAEFKGFLNGSKDAL